MKRNLLAKLFVLLLAIVTLASLVRSVSAETMETVIQRGSLRIGIAAEDFFPWVGRDKAGKPVGFDVDIAQDLARALGVRPEFVETPFADLLAALSSGRVDAIISAYSITTDRARLALFSTPYGETDYYLLVDRKSLPESASEGDYDVAGFRVGVIAGTVEEDIAARSFMKAEIVRLPDDAASRDALVKGEVGGIIAATPIPNFMMLREPDRYAIGSDPLFSTSEAVAVRPDSLRFVNFIDAWLEANRANGRLRAAQDYWFDSLEWEGRVTGEDDADAEKPAE